MLRSSASPLDIHCGDEACDGCNWWTEQLTEGIRKEMEEYDWDAVEPIDEYVLTVTKNGTEYAQVKGEFLEELIDLLYEKVTEDELIDVKASCKKLFDQHEWLQRIPVGAIGTWYKYECAGERYVMDEFCTSYFDVIEDNDDYSEKVLDQIQWNGELLFLGEKEMLSLCDQEWPERGGVIFYINRELELEDEGYDPE